MNDSRENLRLAAEMGYDGVELFGPLLAIPAEELKSLLDEYHLEPISMHAPTSDMVEQLIPLANALDMKFIGSEWKRCSMMTQFMHLPAN